MDELFDQSFDNYLNSLKWVKHAVIEAGVPSDDNNITEYVLKGMDYYIKYRHIWSKPEGYDQIDEEFRQSALAYVKRQTKEALALRAKGSGNSFRPMDWGTQIEEEEIRELLEKSSTEEEQIVVKALRRGYPLNSIADALETTPNHILEIVNSLR